MPFEFATTVETMDDVPAEYKGLYAEGSGDNAGKFTLTEVSTGIVGAYLGQTKALATERSKVKDLNGENAERRTANKAFETFVTEMGIEGDDKMVALKEHIDALTSKTKAGAEVKINLDKINVENKARMDELGASKDKEIAGMQGSLHRYLVTSVATAEISALDGSVALLLPHVEKMTKVFQDGDDHVVRIVDAAGDARSDGKGGFMVVKDLIVEMKTKEEFQMAFKSETKNGGGTQPGSTKRIANPGGEGTELSSKEKIAAGLTARGINNP